MITSDTIQERMRVEPFEPFRIVLSTGKTYEVRHKTSLMVTARRLYVGVYLRPNDEFPERADIVAIQNIVRLESPMPGVY
jgi:hypothetical protein